MAHAKALPILMYHHVSPAPGLVTVSPQTFRSHLQALRAAGWRSAGLDEVARFFAGEPIAPRTCIITFDDGYRDNAIHAAPALQEFGFSAVVFVVTGWLGDGPVRPDDPATPDHKTCKRRIADGDADSVIMRWSELARWREAGVLEAHSHTHSHRRWDQEIVDLAERRRNLAADLQASRAALDAHLGGAGRHLCWPQGYYDEQYCEVAKAAGFDHLYTVEPRMNLPKGPTTQIGRFVTKERDGAWLASRTAIYGRPWLGRLYAALRSR